MARLYPRSTLKRIIKSHQPKASLSKNVDVLVYLDYIVFLNKLAIEARIEAQLDSDKNIQERHVKRALTRVLHQFKG